MENPATWGKAEHVVHEVLKAADEARMDFVCGLSVERQVTDALRAAGLLQEEMCGKPCGEFSVSVQGGVAYDPPLLIPATCRQVLNHPGSCSP